MDQAPPNPPPTSPAVALFGDGMVAWRTVSPSLATARSIAWTVSLLVPGLVLVGLARALWSPLWFGVGALVLGWLWGLWLVRRQVAAISWAELPEELVVRRGRLLRTLVSVPYGRLQFVDLQSGPLARRFGIADVELHTASPRSGGSIPGLPVAEAEALRERLAALGESQRAGL